MGTQPLPISLVAHTVFCDRRAWLEAAGEKVLSAAIDKGVEDHRRIDARKDERPARRRSVDVSHRDLNLTGRCDVVDGSGGALQVVEFKSAPGRRIAEVTDAQRVQLALQGLCLEDAGQQVADYAVFFTTQRTTKPVVVDDALRGAAVEFVHRTRRIVDSATAPPPLVNDARCKRCSHVSVCLPDELGPSRSDPPRRIAVQDPDGEILHLTVPGSRASLSSGRVR